MKTCTASGLVGVLACCLVLNGCALWGRDAETVTLCGRGFANDKEWARTSPYTWKVRTLWEKYPAIEFEGKTVQPAKATTIWFRNFVKSELASCSRHSCDADRCVWRVRLYSQEDGQWQIRSQYDLGRPRR